MHEKNIEVNKNDFKIEGENDIAMMDHLLLWFSEQNKIEYRSHFTKVGEKTDHMHQSPKHMKRK